MAPRSQSRDPRTHLGAFLGQQLREIRTEAGYPTQDALAADLGTDRSVIGKAETGEYPPADAVLARWLDLCGAAGRVRTMVEGVCTIARIRENPEQARVAPWYETESRAHTLRYWQPVIMPGIVQTPAYATELFKAMRYDESKVAESLKIRMGRQEILQRPDPPDITIVLWEPVLRHQIGTRQVMREQIAHLIKLTDLPTVTIHILPTSDGASLGLGGANPGLGGAINLAATDGAPELLGIDGMVEDHLTQDPAIVRNARARFNSVRADALNRAGSRNMLLEEINIWSD